jgi:dTDP-4-amino-4,6-dideoxygalactose transaminase
MINVTRTFLPPMEEYTELLERVWKSHHLTNRGPLLIELEAKLKAHLEVDKILITTNGTLPIQIAIRALDITGDVITTPFSYAATTQSLLWERCKPVFVDIHPEFFTIDESAIEAAITPNTTAILATHVFGNPCDVDKIDEIAKKHNLKVIYDAAHCFGVKYKGQSIFNYGDVSTCSFHATKIFHTGEGGALFCHDEELYKKLFYMHNFGHNGPEAFHGIGINAKISELQAAMGLAVFPYTEHILSERIRAVDYYQSHLDHCNISSMTLREDTEWNFHYFPAVFANEAALIKVQKALNRKNIFPRRYFYPSLNTIDFVNGGSMPVSESLSKRIMCLPLFAEMEEEDLHLITTTIKQAMS